MLEVNFFKLINHLLNSVMQGPKITIFNFKYTLHLINDQQTVHVDINLAASFFQPLSRARLVGVLRGFIRSSFFAVISLSVIFVSSVSELSHIWTTLSLFSHLG